MANTATTAMAALSSQVQTERIVRFPLAPVIPEPVEPSIMELGTEIPSDAIRLIVNEHLSSPKVVSPTGIEPVSVA